MKSTVKEIQNDLKRSLFWSNKKLLFGSFFFTTSLELVTVCSPYITSILMNSAVLGSFNDFLQGCLFAAILTISAITNKLVVRYFVPNYLYHAANSYRNTAFKYMLKKGINSFEASGSSVYVSALTNDLNTIETTYLEQMFSLVSDSISFIVALIMLMVQSIPLTMVAIAASILPLIIGVKLGGTLGKIQKESSAKTSQFIAQVTDLVKGFPLIKAYGATKAAVRLFEEDNNALEKSKRESRKTTRFINTLSWSAFGLSQWAVLIAGTYLCISNQGVTPGVILMATLLMNYISLPLQTIPPVLASRKASNDLILKFSETLADNEEEEGQQTLDKVTEGIVINNLSFAYEQNKAVLKNLSIKLLPNKSYAIVGISGSGKSTLFNLLMGGNLSYQGNIFYDSLELRTIDKKSLYQNVSLVQQENFLFNASIEDNITMFENHSKDAISQACEKAGLTDFIKQNKLSYQCGEAGSNLSGGERQRICIARSLLKGSRVLFFDEATSALDHSTTDQIINSITNLKGTLRLVITHNLEEAQLKKFDEIIVMKEGSIIEKGSFEELMQQNHYFKALYTLEQ